MKALEKISISKGFKRSVNLLEDQTDKAVLKGFICPASSEHVLKSMVQHIEESGQSSFTWTGPYGSGKSSLAVFMSALISGQDDLYQIASGKISKGDSEIRSFFKG